MGKLKTPKSHAARNLKILGAITAATIALAACASSSGGSAKVTETQQSGQAKLTAEAKANVEKATAPVKFISPGGPISVSSLKGKTVWIISEDLSIPFHQNVVRGFKDGAAAVGMHVVVFDGKGLTAEWSRGIEEAVGAHAAGIALISIETSYVADAIKQANAARIPVIGIVNEDSEAPIDPGTAGEATFPLKQSFELLVQYAIANANGKPVHALYADVSSSPPTRFLKAGLEEAFAKYCPDICDYHIYDTEVSNFKESVQGETSTNIQRYPDTNWLFSAFDGQAVFMVPIVHTLGGHSVIQLGSINAVSSNLQLIQNGDVQTVDVGNSNGWLGWAGLDRLMRAVLGAPPATSVVPVRLFDKANLSGVDVSNEDNLFGGGYVNDYLQLWGLS